MTALQAADMGSALSFAGSSLILAFLHSCGYPSPSKLGTEANCRYIFIVTVTPREMKLTCTLFSRTTSFCVNGSGIKKIWGREYIYIHTHPPYHSPNNPLTLFVSIYILYMHIYIFVGSVVPMTIIPVPVTQRIIL